MFASNSAMTAAVALRKNPAYDPLADFTPISMVGRATIFFYTHPSVPAATLKEFIDHARSNPGKLAYGTGNPLSILYNVQLMNSTGISMLHVPYKGEGPLMPDIIAGRVHSSFLSQGNAISLGKEGKLRALASTPRQAQRAHCRTSRPLPRPGTGRHVRQWAGVFGPPKMPRDIVERLNKEVNAALKRPDVLEAAPALRLRRGRLHAEGLTAINARTSAVGRKLVSALGSQRSDERSPAFLATSRGPRG